MNGAHDLIDNRHDGTGASGLDLLLRVVERVLDPARSESASLAVGELILHIVRRLGDSIAPVLPGLLRTLAMRTGTAKTPSFTQTLILPFAYVIAMGQVDTVVALLDGSEVQDLSGTLRPALHVVMNAWCESTDAIQGFWNINISTIGLTHVLASTQPALLAIQARGDRILTAENTNRIVTRAQARSSKFFNVGHSHPDPDLYRSIPLRAKILKLLVSEYGGVASIKSAEAAAADAESDDGNEEWEDDDDGDNEFMARTESDLYQLSGASTCSS